MPRGDKSSYTDKQKRQAEHIEAGYEKRGVPEDEAERRAWATVNKETHGERRAARDVANRKTMLQPARAVSWAARHRRAGRHLNVLDQRRRRQKHGSAAQPDGAMTTGKASGAKQRWNGLRLAINRGPGGWLSRERDTSQSPGPCDGSYPAHQQVYPRSSMARSIRPPRPVIAPARAGHPGCTSPRCGVVRAPARLSVDLTGKSHPATREIFQSVGFSLTLR